MNKQDLIRFGSISVIDENRVNVGKYYHAISKDDFKENIIERIKITKSFIKNLKLLLKTAAKQDVRFFLNGIYFDSENNNLVSTDGHRLAILNVKYSNSNFILSRNAVNAISKSVDSYLVITKDQIYIELYHCFLAVGKIVANYVDYQRVLPDFSKNYDWFALTKYTLKRVKQIHKEQLALDENYRSLQTKELVMTRDGLYLNGQCIQIVNNLHDTVVIVSVDYFLDLQEAEMQVSEKEGKIFSTTGNLTQVLMTMRIPVSKVWDYETKQFVKKGV